VQLNSVISIALKSMNESVKQHTV